MIAKANTLLILLLLTLASLGLCMGADYGVLEAARDLGDLNTFSAAIQKTDLVDTLNNAGLHLGNHSFVVFAPNDQAFQNLPAGTLDALYANNGNLKNLLNYHIIDNDDNQYADLTRFNSIETREGDNLDVSNAGGLTINGARILETKAFGHGIIHVIDRVLMPAKVTDQIAKDMNKTEFSRSDYGGVLQALESKKDLSMFATAIQAADLVGWLDGQGILGTHAGPFTVFAPNDNAFAAVPERPMNYLMNNNKSDLQRVLKYHIVENTDVMNMTTPDMVKTNEGGSINVDLPGNTVNGARILSSMRYNNGIIYTIDRMLFPNDSAFLDKYDLELTTPVTTERET